MKILIILSTAAVLTACGAPPPAVVPEPSDEQLLQSLVNSSKARECSAAGKISDFNLPAVASYLTANDQIISRTSMARREAVMNSFLATNPQEPPNACRIMELAAVQYAQSMAQAAQRAQLYAQQRAAEDARSAQSSAELDRMTAQLQAQAAAARPVTTLCTNLGMGMASCSSY